MRYASISTQKPPGMGKPARPRRARFAALGPNRSASVASAAASGGISWRMSGFVGPYSFHRQRRDAAAGRMNSHLHGLSWLPVARIAGHWVDNGDLLDREIGDDLDAIRV